MAISTPGRLISDARQIYETILHRDPNTTSCAESSQHWMFRRRQRPRSEVMKLEAWLARVGRREVACLGRAARHQGARGRRARGELIGLDASPSSRSMTPRLRSTSSAPSSRLHQSVRQTRSSIRATCCSSRSSPRKHHVPLRVSRSTSCCWSASDGNYGRARFESPRRSTSSATSD